ncbi:unnamed protein product [Moneuplotes crassus]|uniref:Uncharacterized protein n=1 Tax=Euplotes crassus TaxID=5936 RepID=A0AAD2D1P9_EUPCR|nr:unnamed protein product [Moneuplotes crassus]
MGRSNLFKEDQLKIHKKELKNMKKCFLAQKDKFRAMAHDGLSLHIFVPSYQDTTTTKIAFYNSHELKIFSRLEPLSGAHMQGSIEAWIVTKKHAQKLKKFLNKMNFKIENLHLYQSPDIMYSKLNLPMVGVLKILPKITKIFKMEGFILLGKNLALILSNMQTCQKLCFQCCILDCIFQKHNIQGESNLKVLEISWCKQFASKLFGAPWTNFTNLLLMITNSSLVNSLNHLNFHPIPDPRLHKRVFKENGIAHLLDPY